MVGIFLMDIVKKIKNNMLPHLLEFAIPDPPRLQTFTLQVVKNRY